MILSAPDIDLFFRLHWSLMFFVNQRLQVLPDALATPQEYAELLPETQIKVHDALLAHPELFQSFIDENPADLPGEDLAIIDSWRHRVTGQFYILRDLKKHTVLLSSGKPTIAYGVVALSQPFEALVGPRLPVLVRTTLLPFKGRIIYDSMIHGYNISFGPGIRRRLNESYKQAKAVHGIVTSLPMSDMP